MAKSRIFKRHSEAAMPRSLTVFERDALEDTSPAEEPEEEVITPEMVLAEARAEAERKVREAYAEGLRRGREAGEKAFAEAVAESAEALRVAAGAMRTARDRFIDTLEPEVVELAFAIAQSIVQRECLFDRDLVRRTARRALETLADRESMVVRVNPTDLEAMRNEKIRILDEFEDVQQITVVADSAVAPGGCVAESSLMEADARIQSQLEAVLQLLREPPATPAGG